MIEIKASERFTSPTKEVQYFGITVTVLKNTVAIAADSDGEIYAYHKYSPQRDSNMFYLADEWDADCTLIEGLKATFTESDEWQDSLVEYPLEDEQ